MEFVEVGIGILLVFLCVFIGMAGMAALSSGGKEKIAKDAYDLGYERGRQDERKIALDAIEKYSKRFKESVENIFEQKHEDLKAFDKIAEEIKGDAE